MKRQKLRLALLAAALAGTMNSSAALVFTTEPGFLGAINPGYYLEEFNTLPAYAYLGTGPLAYSSGGFSYSITSPGGALYSVTPWGGDNRAVSTQYEADDLLITFTSGNVTAVGGLFLLTDYYGAVNTGTVRVTLSDATVLSFASDTFRGFVTSSGGPVITSLAVKSLSSGDDQHYPTVDHFYVGTTPVPEPTTMIAGALLLLPFGLSTFRFFRKNRTA